MNGEHELRLETESNPSTKAFLNLAEFLLDRARHDEALVACMSGLNLEPTSVITRLMFAEVLFAKGLVGLATSEVDRIVNQFGVRNEIIVKLLTELGGTVFSMEPTHYVQDFAATQANTQEEELADVEFDLDALEELKDQK